MLPPLTAAALAEAAGLGMDVIESGVPIPLPIKSTAIAMAMYSPESKELLVQFHNGRTYVHDGVETDKAIAFAQAPSQGAFYDNHIKESYGAPRSEWKKHPPPSPMGALSVAMTEAAKKR